MNAGIHGNWTMENAKSMLHQFIQMRHIKTDYKYAMQGTSFVAEMSFYVKVSYVCLFDCAVVPHGPGRASPGNVCSGMSRSHQYRIRPLSHLAAWSIWFALSVSLLSSLFTSYVVLDRVVWIRIDLMLIRIQHFF